MHIFLGVAALAEALTALAREFAAALVQRLGILEPAQCFDSWPGGEDPKLGAHLAATYGLLEGREVWRWGLAARCVGRPCGAVATAAWPAAAGFAFAVVAPAALSGLGPSGFSSPNPDIGKFGRSYFGS